GRVREVFHSGLWTGTIVMLAVTIFLQINPYVLVSVFTPDEAVIVVGGEFLKIISLNFIAQGIVFTCSGMFQGLGHTRPALMSSAFRLALFIPLSLFMASREGFVIHDIWYVSVLSVWMQACLSVWLVQRELRARLARSPAEVPAVDQHS